MMVMMIERDYGKVEEGPWELSYTKHRDDIDALVHHISHRVLLSRRHGSRTQARRVQHLFESGKLRRVGVGSELPDYELSAISLAVVSTTTATLGSGILTALTGQQARSAAGGLSDAETLIGTLDTLGMALWERHVDFEPQLAADSSSITEHASMPDWEYLEGLVKWTLAGINSFGCQRMHARTHRSQDAGSAQLSLTLTGDCSVKHVTTLEHMPSAST
ncbi:hypothetical protein GGTG_02744 [Gaeumannomyces tritici R3-111a-1]|uniref:Uncharacterized protein n=1 Tax=Gaeumannomyces tritici (strain R3-111a-1) TaxID=644352 RepID=J3NN86_GAET3|nr:hypothetical protein GGTG_02744 [Gaeumannomyces tritici R3-111a-1]EJT77638.1 hypothetical protein GGTG_02744 [Gaeumannomyces tritici R3-111a-1]